MNRRDLLKVVGVGPLAAAASCAFRAETYGRIDVEAWQRYDRRGVFLEVYLDDRNVTLHCREADDVEGYVVLLCHDATHHRNLDGTDPVHVRPGRHDEICEHRIRGRVRIRPRGRRE